MTEPTDQGQQSGQAEQQAEQGKAEKTFTQADLDQIVKDRITRERAKFADYDDLKKKAAAAMTEQERAVAEAKDAGRAEAIAETGGRLVKAEFKAAAAGRLPNLDQLLEDLNLAKFLGANGEPDTKAIAAAVERFGASKTPDFDGGARGGSAKTNDMNALIRRAAGLG